MRPTPSYMVQKVLGSMDPLQPYRQPYGGLYKAARTVRDLPFNSALGAAVGIGALAISPIMPLPALAYAGASIYATTVEAVNAAPTALRFLERAGSGKPEFSAPMVDTQASSNMRQSAMRAIHDSGYMTRSIIGREARAMHR